MEVHTSDSLNKILERNAPQILNALSPLGKKACFPDTKISGQVAAIGELEIDLASGLPYEDNGQPMSLQILRDQFGEFDPTEVFPYESPYGNTILRQKWQQFIRKLNPSLPNIQISLPVVTSGITNALSIAGLLFVGEGDRVIVPDLRWDTIEDILRQGNTKMYPFLNEQRQYNVKGLEERLLGPSDNVYTGQKQIVYLNFPHNPTGYQISEEEADQIAEVLKKSADQGNTVIALIDDAYFGYVHDSYKYQESLFAKIANLDPRVIAVKADGYTKQHFFAGGRVGFLTYGFKGMTDKIDHVLAHKTAGEIQRTTGATSTVSQSAALAVLKGYERAQNEIELHRGTLKERKDLVNKLLERHQDLWEVLPNHGAYYVSVRPIRGNAADIQQRLRESGKVRIVSFNDDVLRISYGAGSKEDISKGINYLVRHLESLPSPT